MRRRFLRWVNIHVFRARWTRLNNWSRKHRDKKKDLFPCDCWICRSTGMHTKDNAKQALLRKIKREIETGVWE